MAFFKLLTIKNEGVDYKIRGKGSQSKLLSVEPGFQPVMIPTTQNQIFVITEWLNSFSDEHVVLTTSILAKQNLYKLTEEHRTQVSKKYRESLVGGDRDVLIPISGKLLLLIQCLHIVWLISTVAGLLRSNWPSWYVCSCPHTSDFPQFSYDIESEATNAFV